MLFTSEGGTCPTEETCTSLCVHPTSQTYVYVPNMQRSTFQVCMVYAMKLTRNQHWPGYEQSYYEDVQITSIRTWRA